MAGAPTTKLPPKVAQVAIAMSTQGASYQAAAVVVGIRRAAQSRARWEKHPAFIAALEEHTTAISAPPVGTAPRPPVDHEIASVDEALRLLSGIMRGDVPDVDRDGGPALAGLDTRLKALRMLLEAQGAFKVSLEVSGAITHTISETHRQTLNAYTDEELAAAEALAVAANRRAGLIVDAEIVG